MFIDAIFDIFVIFFSYTFYFLVLVAGGMIPILPEEILLFSAGYLVFLGIGSFWGVFFTSILGIIGGDILGYLIGYKKGEGFLELVAKRGRYWRRLLRAGKRFFNEYDERAVLFGRFFIGARFAVPFLAGALKMPWKKFIQYDIVGALVWVTATVGGGTFLSYSLDQAEIFNEKYLLYIAIVAFIIFYSVWRFFTYKE
ncbi:MAG: DedA family protein [Patescibacteria group bacterium]